MIPIFFFLNLKYKDFVSKLLLKREPSFSGIIKKTEYKKHNKNHNGQLQLIN
jgi:hypothetical protein